MQYLLSHSLDRSSERAPERAAMRFGGRGLTYGDWLLRADALARALWEQGVRKGDRVGIYLNKCLESAIAIYGIWKAGGAYVPLDPLAPAARLAFVLNDCGIRHLVSHAAKADGVRALTGITPMQHVIGLEPGDGLPGDCIPWSALARPAGPPPPARLMEHDLAYVMYTSGSTGVPKGLMHTHYSGLSYARLSAHTYGVSASDRLANHSPLHFDMSTFEYFTGPLCGATTVIIPEGYTKLPASLAKLIDDERITIWYSVPYALVQLLLRGALEQRDLSSLRWVNFGGEPFPPKHLAGLMRRLPSARFSNVYGPAEVNQCTYYHVPALSAENESRLSEEQAPIGRAWDDTEVLVLGDDDVPVAGGDVGELVVRTPTMMRGYWGRPDLNAKAFYRRQAFGHYDDVFYRTGDLVREDGQGELHFLGRKDRQVKSRGHRVELDEIEIALSGHADVEECAAFVLADTDGSSSLCAAAVLRPGATAGERDIAAHLQGVLPWYAVPARIALLEDFPRTGSGKIDRRALVVMMSEHQTGS